MALQISKGANLQNALLVGIFTGPVIFDDADLTNAFFGISSIVNPQQTSFKNSNLAGIQFDQYFDKSKLNFSGAKVCVPYKP